MRIVLKILMLLLLIDICSPARVNAQQSGEKVWFVFNQPKYAPGDTAFFSGFLLNAGGEGFRVMSVGLVDQQGIEVLHNRILFKNDRCNSQIVIPEGIPAGIYMFNGYFENGSDPHISYKKELVVAGEKEIVQSQVGDDSQNFSTTPDTDVKLEVELRQDEWTPREKVELSLSVQSGEGRLIESIVSVSVIHKDLFEQLPLSNTMVNDPADVVGGLPPVNTTPFFRGKVAIDSGRTKLPDSLLLSFYFTMNDFSYQLFAERDGSFEFPLLKPYGNEVVFYAVTRKGDRREDAQILLTEPQPELNNGIATKVGNTADQYFVSDREKHRIDHAFRYYATDSPAEIKPYEFEDVWHDADELIEMSKYEPFSTMEEVLSSIMQSARVRQRNKIPVVRIFLSETARFAQGDPIYFINGKMTGDTQLFLSLDPTKISRLGVLRSIQTLSHFGQLGRNGAILVRTSQKLDQLETCNHCLEIVGINNTLELHTPSYDMERKLNSRIPDLRRALFWNPGIAIDSNGKMIVTFYTSDVLGTYKVLVRGVTSDGRVIAKETSFVVDISKD